MKQETLNNNIEVKQLQIRDCGVCEYRKILDLQHELLDGRRNNQIPNTVIIVEHPDVITLGVRQSLNKLRVSRDELAKRNIDTVQIRRGGGTTVHNPGQLVFYPIINLKQLSLGISEYIRTLEQIGQELLTQFDLASDVKKGYPGLWVGDKKIASIGVRVSKFITYHGMAINIQNDLGIFDYIEPCGLDNIEMTSLAKETGKEYSMELIKQKLTEILMRHFS
ncbi:MAG: lipoyl(octanoyl) transferase LipB [Sedimentisphaerales bacterium]|nr:lipoyl(octanoyl) transferase LipB [Sedimentisphaerales bacterium]